MRKAHMCHLLTRHRLSFWLVVLLVVNDVSAGAGLKPVGQVLGGGWQCVRTGNKYLLARVNPAAQRAECFAFNAVECQWEGTYACTSDGKVPSARVNEATVNPRVAKPREQNAVGSWEYDVYATGEASTKAGGRRACIAIVPYFGKVGPTDGLSSDPAV